MQVKVTLTLKEEELKKIMDESGLTTADGIKGYCIGSTILRNISYEFSGKWDIGFEVIEDEPCPTIAEVKEVKRKAKVGEWIRITREPGLASADYYKENDILKVYKLFNNVLLPELLGVFCELKKKVRNKSELINHDGNIVIWDSEYVVLENYQPEDGEKK